jgi:hypothetical protein
LPGGSSGGPHGIPFGLENKKYAIIGNTSSDTVLPSASRQIPFLRRQNFTFNTAHYNTATGKIEEVIRDGQRHKTPRVIPKRSKTRRRY